MIETPKNTDSACTGPVLLAFGAGLIIIPAFFIVCALYDMAFLFVMAIIVDALLGLGSIVLGLALINKRRKEVKHATN